MDLGDQRAGGVDDLQIALLGLLAHRRRNAVRAEDHARALGNFAQFFDKNRAGLPQFVHHVPVVDDLFTNIYRRAIKIENDLDHIDRPHHSGAKTTRAQEDDFFHGTGRVEFGHRLHYTSRSRKLQKWLRFINQTVTDVNASAAGTRQPVIGGQ